MYNPGISYTGDRYLFDAIGGIGEDFERAIQKREQNARENAYNDMIVGHAADQGQVDQDWLSKYETASHNQKTGMAAGLAANIVADWKQNAQEAQLTHTGLQNQLLESQLNQTGPYAPNPSAQQPIWADDGKGKQVQIGVFGDRGEPHFFPYGRAGGSGDFTPSVTTLTDPSTGKPFSVYSRSPNQVDLTPGSQTEHPMARQVINDPQTGDPIGVYGPNGEPKFFPKKSAGNPFDEEVARIMRGGNTQPSATPELPKVGDVRKGYRYKGGNPAEPGSWEMESSGVDKNAALAQARAKIAAGADRSAVISRLRQLGIDPNEL